MESPLNKKIQRSLERVAAKKKKDSNYIPVLTLRERVLSLVTEANANALQERHITPRSALTVMDRSIERLSALKGDAKDFAVLREVASYISTAQKTFVASASTHTDLLPQGHPLSSLNASLTPEEYRFKYAQWLAADPDVSHNARPLVAAAFSAQPGSLEREHAFMRLSVTSEKVPGYFKLDPAPIVAAFSSGNSSAARRARVALQWRDKKGRWVEMGRGANFRYRTSSGSVAAASGVYVGVSSPKPGAANQSSAGLIQVTGDKNLPDGIYAVQPNNAETYSARIPAEALKKAGVTPGLRPDQSALGIPTQEEIMASRQDAPTGWTKKDDNTFTSDDNYTVKVTDGEYTLFRQNADGSLGDKVGEGANWADVNDLANNDEEAYDAVKGQDNSAGREEVKARIQGRTKYNEEFDRLEELVKSGVDQNGNTVPAGWEADIKRGAMPEVERRAIGRDRVFGEEGLPYLEYSKTYADDNGNPVTAKAMFMRDGKFYANDKEYDSWDAAEADIPNWIKAEEDKRDRKLTPVKPEEIKLPAFEDGPSDIVNPFEPEPARDDRAGFFDKDGNRLAGPPSGDSEDRPLTPEQLKRISDDIQIPALDRLDKSANPFAPSEIPDYRAGYFDKDGNRLIAPDNVIKPPQDLKVGDEVYIPNVGWRKVKNVSKDERRAEGRRKPVSLYKVEYEDEEGKTGTWKWTPFSEDDQGNKIKGLETRTPIEERLSSLTEEQNKKIDAEIRDLIKNPPAPTEMDKRVEKLLQEQRAEWDKANEENYARVFDGRIGGEYDFLGPEKTRKAKEEFRKNLEKNKKPDGSTPTGSISQQILALRESDSDAKIEGTLDNGVKYTIYKKNVQATWRGETTTVPDVITVDLSGRTFDARQAIKQEMFRWNATDKVWRRTHLGIGPYQYSDPMAIQATLEKLNGGNKLAGKEAILPSAAEMRQQMERNSWTPEILARRNGVSVEEINAILDGDATGKPSGATGKEIYERRIATGDSLDKVAKDLGIPREEVRRLEAEYGRTLDGGTPGEPTTPPTGEGDSRKSYTVDFALDSDSYDEIGLDPEKDYTDEEVANAWIKSKGLDGKVEFVKADNPSGQWPEFTFKIDENSKDAFAEAYGYDSWSDLNEDQQFDEGDGDGPNEPTTPPTGGGEGDNTPGAGFVDYVIDLAEDNRDLGKDLEEKLDDDAEEAGIDLMDQIYEDASDRFDLSQDIADNKPDDMSDDEFVEDAVAKMREQLSDIVDAAIEERRSLEDDEELEVDFDRDAFIDAAANRFEELLRNELDGMGDEDGEGPGEPPAPPSGGTPPKTPSPSTPSAPGLFSEFEAPDGAFKLRTADYDPEGRVDERSTDFTDDPERLATKFTVQDLIAAFSEAIIGNSSDAAVAEILNVNVDDDNELDAPSEVDLDADIPQVSLGTPSGAGRLEFNAGEEFVPAEALFNALWHAGVDPNRVLANVYDSVTGDNKNLAKLIDAQGGTPSAEEAQLVDDITAEIRQIKDATPDDEPSIANQKDEPSEELTGSLLENLPIDFENPDYYIPDSSSYVPSQEEPDENGYTDNPEILATDYEEADLIMQMLEGITDGSGAALLNFGDITTEVPVEAIRDALQLQGINTNDILVDLKRESNDMSEPESDAPTLQLHSRIIKDLVEQTGNTLDDDTADNIRDAINEQGLIDWSEADEAEIIEAIIDVAGPGIFTREDRNPRRFGPTAGEQASFSPFADALEGEEDSISPEQAEQLDSSAEALVNFFTGGLNGARVIAYNPQAGLIAASTKETDLEGSQIILATAEGNVQTSAIVDEEWFAQDGARLGWEPVSQEVVNAIYKENGRLFPDTAMSAPIVPDVVETEPQSNEVEIDSPENVTPQFNYPGPREAGYTPNNVVRDSNGVAVGAGARVKALGDGRTGTILAVQNIDTRTGRDADYVRVRFDDGKVAVRSARQIFGIEGGSPVAEGEGPGQLPPARRNPIVQDPVQRFNEPPAAGTPVIAGDGSIPGVKLVDTPDDIAELANPDAKQSDFVAWGLRAPEIARAGRDRAAIENIVDLVDKEKEAKILANDTSASPEERDKARNDQAALDAQIQRLIRDAFGIRPGVQFGKNNYTIGQFARVSYDKYASGDIELSIGFRILNENGDDVGEGSRTLNGSVVRNADGTSTIKWTAVNNLLKIPNARDKKSGFVNAYNRYMEDWYIANGFEKVKVYAAGNGREWQGGLVWALNGFNWQDNQASEVPTILRRMANKPGITDEEKQIIKRMQDRVAKDNPTGNYTADTVPTPLEIALIGWYPGATSWAGAKYMIGTSWYGQKRLDPQAIEQRQAINYNQSREARKRIDGKLNQAGISRELVLKMNSNEFADANPELVPYLDQIRDVLRNNRSLAVLSPAAKTALNRYTAGQLLKGEGREASLQDIFKLRTALDAEFKADNPLAISKEFGVGNQLLDASYDDIGRNNVPGFTIKRLGMYESGINDTYMVTHNDSGQVFFVKKDSYAAQYQIDGAGAEVQADAMLRASGVAAGYEARVSNVDPEIIVMQRAGAGIPLLGEPMTATNAIGNKLSINLPDGTTVKVDAKNFMDLLHTPEDAVRVILVDLIISNMDRHNGNLLLAVDGTDTGKIRILPIDHALSSFSPDTEGMQFTVEELFDNRGDNLYGMAMPVLTERLKQEEILDLFRNEARKMMMQLDDPANLPTGKELDLIVKNFGSLNAYRAKIQERIDSLLSPGTEGHQAFLSALDPNYWSR